MKAMLLLAATLISSAAFANGHDLCRPGAVRNGVEIRTKNPRVIAEYCVLDKNQNDYVWSTTPDDIQVVPGVSNQCSPGETRANGNIGIGRDPKPAAMYCVYDHNYNFYVWSSSPEDLKRLPGLHNQCRPGKTRVMHVSNARRGSLEYKTAYCSYSHAYGVYVWATFP